MNENLCIAIITAASIFAGFLVAFLSSYLTARDSLMKLVPLSQKKPIVSNTKN